VRARILTVRFSPTLGVFDDSALQEFVRDKELLDLREHVVAVCGIPCIACVVTWQEAARPAAEACADALPAAAPAAAAAPPSANGPARPMPELLQGLTDPQRALFDALRKWRYHTAQQEGAPPYVVLTNRQLVEIVRQRPASRTALGRIDGIGDKKLERYAAALLHLLHPAAEGSGAGAGSEAPAPAEADA
jgi:superfamily II DNA helicase RecQ